MPQQSNTWFFFFLHLNLNNNFGRKSRAEAESHQGPSAYQPYTLPLGQTSLHKQMESTSYPFTHTPLAVKQNAAPSECFLQLTHVNFATASQSYSYTVHVSNLLII